jgi:RHH-type proline utilization regulon transcriptional repressor/proline dehydrogenase/delta 1-pyrroline-5-carboxylate dehydrogenase
MIFDGAKTGTEADVEVSEAVDFALLRRTLRESAGELSDAAHGAARRTRDTALELPALHPHRGVFAALAAGNAVVLKPGPEALLVGWWLANCLWDGGVPREVLQFLPCPDDEVGRGLVTNPGVGAVILTGSVETARLFLGWRPDLTLLAETSGKNAIIITRSPIEIRPSAIWSARPSATTARSARRRAWPSAKPRCTRTRCSAVSSATPPRASPSATPGIPRAASRR